MIINLKTSFIINEIMKCKAVLYFCSLRSIYKQDYVSYIYKESSDGIIYKNVMCGTDALVTILVNFVIFEICDNNDMSFLYLFSDIYLLLRNASAVQTHDAIYSAILIYTDFFLKCPWTLALTMLEIDPRSRSEKTNKIKQ